MARTRARAGLHRDPVIWLLLLAVAGAALLAAQLYLAPDRAIAAQRDRVFAMLGVGPRDASAGDPGPARPESAAPLAARPGAPAPLDPPRPALGGGSPAALPAPEPPRDPLPPLAPPAAIAGGALPPTGAPEPATPATGWEERGRPGAGPPRPDGQASPPMAATDEASGVTGPSTELPAPSPWDRDAADRDDAPVWPSAEQAPGPNENAYPPAPGDAGSGARAPDTPAPGTPVDGGGSVPRPDDGPFGPTVVVPDAPPATPTAARTRATALMSEGRACAAVALLGRFADDPDSRGLLAYARERCDIERR
jgi:hypothetical protein